MTRQVLWQIPRHLPQQPFPFSQTRQRGMLVAVLLLAALLRFYCLTCQSLWADEGNSVALAQRGFMEIAHHTAFDIHPPFYYWLLKVWTGIFGTGEVALRSLSAVLGVGLVYLIWRLGVLLFNRRIGLLAAFIAALSPFQVYYAQETRMYMLLTFLGALTVLLTLHLISSVSTQHWLLVAVAYIITVTAGLYTHYAYPLILILVNLFVIAQYIPKDVRRRRGEEAKLSVSLFSWFCLQLLPILLYLPWLPTAWRQLTTWPSTPAVDAFPAKLAAISTTLLFGPAWPYSAGLLATAGLMLMMLTVPLLIRLMRYWPYAPGLLYLWFLLPVGLTLAVYSPAFLKFLLIATPPLALLLALLIGQLARLSRLRWPGYILSGWLLVGLAAASLVSLATYYTNPTFARDNYRGIVQFIQAVGSQQDAVILNAAGQQDVFNYYYHQADTALEAAVYPLPRRRPLDETETVAELQAIAANAANVYVVYWATQQADPTGVIEGWLNTHLFKATDQWYGNVRLVSYASPQPEDTVGLQPLAAQLGDAVWLKGYALSAAKVVPGDILQVALQWQSTQPLTEDYTVFLQVLDSARHVVGQRDAQPLRPTSHWPVDETVADTHGIFIEPGTPPGRHRVIAGLYNPQTGLRLPVGDAAGLNYVDLGEIEVVQRTMPDVAFRIQHRLDTPLLATTLLGYDFYKLGHRATPGTLLRPGDAVQLVGYWQRQRQDAMPDDELLIEVVTDQGEATSVAATFPLAGVDYPVEVWQTGEIVRAQYDFFLTGLEPGRYRLALTVGPTASSQKVTALTAPFQVE